MFASASKSSDDVQFSSPLHPHPLHISSLICTVVWSYCIFFLFFISETKRLELERKLFEYSRSDVCRAKLKYAKLKKYLKEICERQKNAILRNQELLKEFDHIEARFRTFPSSERLQKLKVQNEKEINSTLILDKNNMLIKGDKKEGNNKQKLLVARQAGINTGTAMSRGLYHPATIFMGRQMSAISSIEDFSTQQKSSQPTKSFSISDPHSCRQAVQSSNMTDSCVVQTNSDIQCLNKSDKIDGKTYLPIGEKMPVTSSISSENGGTHFLETESNTNNGNSNLVESKKSAQLNSLLHERLSPENRTADFKSDSCSRSVEEVLAAEHFVAKEERSKQQSPLVSPPKHIVSENEHPREGFPDSDHNTGNLWPTGDIQELENESLDTSSDLTVSVSEEDQIINAADQLDGLGDVDSKMALKSVNLKKEKGIQPTEDHFSLQTGATDDDPSANSTMQDCLSFEGFSHLLQFIEDLVEKAGPEYMTLYQSGTISASKMKQLISFCNQTENVKKEDLEACEAVVLHQLQRLLQSTFNGCLLPEKTLNDRGRIMDEKQARSDQSLDFAMLWERLSKHILFLKKHNVLLTEEVKEMFGILLISERNSPGGQATPLLREIFPEECEDRSSIHSNESSYSLPSVQNDNGEIKQAKHALWLDNTGTREQEITSWCEDESKEESLVEKIPITGLNTGNREKTERSNKISSEASFSSSDGRSPLSRTESKRRVIPAIKSKAFWGESDDSNSEIEAALRPQTQNTHADEFDDFYD
ncbi:centrosomal protein kizuna isoform X4 [Alligator sinensis]|uniref:Centrosomal protein kizuna n=1 Tax=Alligator sinensis TaxID=38654 RepID=A0A3Q0GHY4_ALLSI|nr:centrosomal protein kizuna isoform X4 [Alligator sinensis]